MPYADVVIGNESEAAAWSATNGGKEVNPPLSPVLYVLRLLD